MKSGSEFFLVRGFGSAFEYNEGKSSLTNKNLFRRKSYFLKLFFLIRANFLIQVQLQIQSIRIQVPAENYIPEGSITGLVDRFYLNLSPASRFLRLGDSRFFRCSGITSSRDQNIPLYTTWVKVTLTLIVKGKVLLNSIGRGGGIHYFSVLTSLLVKCIIFSNETLGISHDQGNIKY